MKKIIINSPKYGRKEILVDDEDYDIINKAKWHLLRNKRGFYATRQIWNKGNQKCFYMHRVILGINKRHEYIDHIDGDGLNNQRSNLRIATPKENAHNIKPRANGNGLVGVHWDKNRKLWMAYIMKDYKRRHLGRFENKEEAIMARDKAAKELFGEFAYINLPHLISA